MPSISSSTPNGFHAHDTTNGHAASKCNLDVLIVGAGLGGLASAIACSLAGHSVVCLEAAQKLGEVGAGIQLSPNVTRLLRKWGLFTRLKPIAVEPGRIYFRRWQTGQEIGVTNLVPDFERDFGAPYWVVHRAHLHQALYERALELGVVVHVDSRVHSIDFDKGQHAGKCYSGDLILGCDGLKSVTRAAFLNGQDPGPASTRFCAYRATVPIELLESDPELAPLVANQDLSAWIGHDRHVMSYPINGGKTFNMVLSHPAGDEKESDWAATDPQQVLDEMKANYQGWDPRLVKIIGLIKSTSKWKLMTYPRLASWAHANGKYVLMGDACHAMLPYMSQGAAQAIEDAAALGVCLRYLTDIKMLPVATRAYEAIRMRRAYAVQARSTLNGKIWHYEDGPDQIRRDAGMAATLTGEHYVRSTNQWSDPSTQIWLYNHDAEMSARIYMEQNLGLATPKGMAVMSARDELVAEGLLARED